MRLTNCFQRQYKGRKVLVTGHTGFKGSWLSLWLQELGAEVCGLGLTPHTNPNHHELLGLGMESHIGDIRDEALLRGLLDDFQPEIVFHLAAQALVLPSFDDPVGTLSTNVIGTANLLEACRHVKSVKAVLNVTSDKCYENREWPYGYRECDRLGGHDPYSASKACAEIVSASFAKSFGASSGYLIANCRAGNVIGGGDWAKDRLLPDAIQAAASGKSMHMRNSRSTRPWQHVLEPLSGYLQLGEKLLKGQTEFASAWNFGCDTEDILTVREVIEAAAKQWPAIRFHTNDVAGAPEAQILFLDCTRAKRLLRWHTVWDLQMGLNRTVQWYREFYENGRTISREQLLEYTEDAIHANAVWREGGASHERFA